jgi:hypothetical protein
MPTLRKNVEIESNFQELDQINEGMARLAQQQAVLTEKRAIVLHRMEGQGVVLRKIAAHTGKSPQTIANWKQPVKKGADEVPVQQPVTRRALPVPLSSVRRRNRTA